MSHLTNDLGADEDTHDAFEPNSLFADLDPGYYDESSHRWRKPASSPEEYVYQKVHHDRILKYFTTRDGYLDLEFHPNGDLWTYLVEKKPPLTTRIEWAVQIVEGLAHHSHFIVWADADFRNILVTANIDIVLCDFAYSVSSPDPFHSFTTQPPPIFRCPWDYYGQPPTHVDIFGFAVILFALLTNRFPWTHDLLPDLDAQLAASAKHDRGEFDTVESAELNTYFGSISSKCFLATYATGTELLDDMRHAREMWLQGGGGGG
ncbi:kinase-like domain-containing protein [Mycena rosella]|uniref:Kinase-like domain-containing protein n=1 Tax=Mycena rosella TaxID=1033263 RepID=A0AAD7C2V8_MYCRO|nr:kinase-like domain-containing protein [Mycena rosella]